MAFGISGESSAAFSLNALTVSPDLVASIARNLEALTILEGEARLAAHSNALVSGGIKLEAIAASFSDTSAFSVVLPASLAINDTEVTFESGTLRAAGSLANTFLGSVVHVALRLAALAILESPTIRAADSDARAVNQGVVLRAGQQEALSVSQGVSVGALASDTLLSFEGEAFRAGNSDAFVSDLLVVLGALLSLETFAVLENILSWAADSGALLVSSQGKVLRALVSDALVLGLRVDMLSIAIDFEALAILQFETSSARDSNAFTVDQLEISGTASSDAFVTDGGESFSAVVQTNTVGEGLASRATSSDASLFLEGEVLFTFASSANAILKSESLRAGFSDTLVVLQSVVLAASDLSANTFNQGISGIARNSGA